MRTDADILIEDEYDFKGSLERRNYTWQGGKVAYISGHFLSGIFNTTDTTLFPKTGEVFSVGTLRLRVVGTHEAFCSDDLYVSLDGWFSWIYYRIRWATRLLDLTYRRLVLTAVVWRLARYGLASIPTWRDIHLLRRLFGDG